MEFSLHPSWQGVLNEELNKDYFKNLMQFVTAEYAIRSCFPPRQLIFAAMNYTPFEDVKVVILGQDPYHGAGQANGLCFSVGDGIKMPPSLINIFKEISTDLGTVFPESGNLERWAQQGVLLLNTVLTVQEAQAGSHAKKGWERFTDAAISAISTQGEHVVFMLWGGFAKKKAPMIDQTKHLVLESGHPSPLSANRGHWFNNQHFSKANSYLESVHKTPINW